MRGILLNLNLTICTAGGKHKDLTLRMEKYKGTLLCFYFYTNTHKWPAYKGKPNRGVTGKFFWRGKVIFPGFFSRRKMLFPRRKISILVHPKQISAVLKSEKKRKKNLSSFWDFSLLPFPIFHLPFYNFPFFLLHFSLPLFPGRSAEISLSEISGGHSAPHLLHHWSQTGRHLI